MIEWHRSGGGGMRRALIVAGVLVTIGPILVGAAFVSRLGTALGHGIAVVGACLVVGGLVYAISNAVSAIQEDRYLAVRKDGILLHSARDQEMLVPWSDLRSIAAEGMEVVLSRVDDKVERWTAGGDAGKLAARLEDLRKKAALGIELRTTVRERPASVV
jgi:hypothetical protein